MLKTIQHLRDSRHISLIYALLVFSCGVWGIFLIVSRLFDSTDFLSAFVSTMAFFTTQSNILALIITSLFLLDFGAKRWFKHLALVGLVNITMTALIFNTLLGPFMDHVNLIQYVLHIINPVLYIALYYLFFNFHDAQKHFYYGVIYPAIYIVLIYTVIEPYLGKFMIHAVSDFEGSRYVYPFFDPANYESYPKGTMFFFILLLCLSVFALSYFLVFLKRKLEEAIKKIK